MLAQDDTIERDSISVFRWNNGTVNKKIDNQACFEISYRLKGSDKVQYAYFDYFAYYRDGDKVGTAKHNGVEDADHIVVLKKTVTETNADGTASKFDGKGEVFFSERALDAGEDAYQSSAAAVRNAEAALDAARAERESADEAAARYADLDAAKEALINVQNELNEAKSAFSDDERMEELISLIRSQKETVNAAKNSQAFWKANEKLSIYYTEYALRQQGNLTSFTVDDWISNNGTQHHYFKATYTLDGVEHTDYFDYIVLYTNGETLNGDNQDAHTYVGKSSLFVKDSSMVIDHIVIMKKGEIRSSYDDGTPKTFAGKGEAFFSEGDFNTGKDAYQSAKTRIADLEQAVSNAQSVVSIAENIQALKEQSAAADALKDKVEAARKKVNDAAAALQQARIRSSMNADMLAGLTEKLAAARAEYDEALDELDTAS